MNAAVPDVSQERFLESRLLKMGVAFSWISDADQRKQRFRNSITASFVDQAFAGRRLGGGMETFGQLFERIFNEALRPQLQPASNTGEKTT